MENKPTRLSNKETVLQTAASLFLTRGYQLTSMDDIVATSSVSKTNIYYHYKNKEELLLAIMDRLIEQYDRQFSWILSREEHSISERLSQLLGLLADNQEQQDILGGCPFLTLYIQAPPTSLEIAAKVRMFFEQQLSKVEQLLKRGIENNELHPDLSPSAVAVLIVTSIEGALFIAKATGRPLMLRELQQGLESMFLLKR